VSFHNTKDKDKQKKKVAFAAVEEESSDCNEEDEVIDAAWITFADTVAAALSDKRLGPSDVLVDNSATVCIVNNPALLEDITDLASGKRIYDYLPRRTSTCHRKSALLSRLHGQRDLAVENCEERTPRSRLPKGRRQIPRNRHNIWSEPF